MRKTFIKKANMKTIISAMCMAALCGASVKAENVVIVIHLYYTGDYKSEFDIPQKSGSAPYTTFDGQRLAVYSDAISVEATIVNEAGGVLYYDVAASEGGCANFNLESLPKGNYTLYVETEKGTYYGEFRVG